MKNKIGLQIYSVREDFAENPFETLRTIKKMGYDGIEFNYNTNLPFTAEKMRRELDEIGLECYSAMSGWGEFSTENIKDTVDYMETLGARHVIIGNIDFAAFDADESYAKQALERMIEINEYAISRGLSSGYHAHQGDFTRYVGEDTFYEYILKNTPASFAAVIDSGNIEAGGGDPISIMKKYPNRSPIVHVKGYNEIERYAAAIWDSETNWNDFFSTAKAGKTELYFVELSARGDYVPLKRAAESYDWLKGMLESE